MSLSGFLDTLQKSGIETYVEDVLDALWLAKHLKDQSLYELSGTVQPTLPVDSTRSPEKRPEQPRQEDTRPPSGLSPPQDTSIFPRGKAESQDGRKASVLTVPAPRSLPNRLALSRAMRPFGRRWGSTHEVEIDEEGSVDAIASLGFFRPIFRPAPERWYSVEVVLEDDTAINVWRPMLREFCQLLRNTGAFRDVRLWHLRLRPHGSEATGFTEILETTEGARISPRVLAGAGVRRLIFFATHGSSIHWVDGAYKSVLEAWLSTATVALLHLLPQHQWKRTALGPEQGVCHTTRPGVATSLLDAEPFWWTLLSENNASFVPIVALEPRDFARFAEMQMGRGRNASVVFLDSSHVDREAMEAETPVFDVARIVAGLKAASPDAFHLAVYLCSAPFTLPVARLIQELKFGSDPLQSMLADVLLSGLVVSRSPQSLSDDPESIYYEFSPEAREILIRSLRQADAELLAQELKEEVSRYINAISGRWDAFQALFPDDDGKFDLPAWVQSFAHVRRVLLRDPSTRDESNGLVARFRAEASPQIFLAAAELATSHADILIGRDASDEVVLKALIEYQLVRQDVGGEWHFRAGIAEALIVRPEIQQPSPPTSRPLPSATIETGLVYIYSAAPARDFKGCGAVVEGGYIATCRHVWRAAIVSKNEEADEPSEAEIVYPFARDQDVSTSRAWLADSCEIQDEPAPDLVLLKPDGIPSGVIGLQLATSERFETGAGYAHAGRIGHDSTYPNRVPDILVEGQIASYMNAMGLRQFTGSNSQGHWFNWGASGSPVFLEGGQQLAGIVALSELGTIEGESRLHEAFVVPATTIYRYLSRLNERLAEDQQAAQGGWIRRPQGEASAVFVHGILSSGETCWRNDNGSYWPELLKSEPELGSLGIYVFTYETGIFSGSYRLRDIVDDLKEHMRVDGVLASDRLIFVCHSMGGIVVREYIVERQAELIRASKEIDFFLVASPSLGASYADWLSPLAQLFGHAQADALRFVRTNNWLMDLDKEFVNLKEGGKLKIKGKELVEDKFVYLKRFLRRQVVEPFSGARYFGEPFKVPESDHFSIAKPDNKDAIQHRLLRAFILENALSPVPAMRNTHINHETTPPGPPAPAHDVPAYISRIIKYAPAHLIGREAETQVLKDAWAKAQNNETKRPHVLTFVALGGEGKTSLVAKWAADLAYQNWPGCDAVFAWSFYSQGTREQVAASSDVFLKEALTFFGDAAMAGSAQGAFDKGRRLAQLVGERRALLILDGLEPLQYAPSSSPTPGQLKDAGLVALLKGLAANNKGLCVVTTRYSIPDLRAYWQTTVQEEELRRLSAEAGVALLKLLEVKGTQAEYETLVEEVKGHALTLTLLGAWLRNAHAGDIRKRDQVKLEEADKEQSGPKRRTMPAMPVRDIPDKFLVAFSFAGEQRDLVHSIAEGVEERLGRSNVFLDDWYEHYLAGADADIVLQDIYRNRCVLAVVCVSAYYGNKPWTLAEHDAIRERVNKCRTSDREEDRLGVLLIRVGDGDVEGISFNTIVPDVRPTERTLGETVELIVNRLHLVAPGSQEPGASPAHPDWPNEPISFEHGLADRAEQWAAVQKFMTADTAKRVLMFKGPSGYSKSALLNAAARYAKILSVPTAYVDFKDSQMLRQADVLQRLRLDLGAVLPGFVTTKEPDPWTLLQALRQLSSPALILLDTYEKITETKELFEWIENFLLGEVERCKQLRFLIGGQKVPERTHTRWRDLAEEFELNSISDKQAWTEWIQQINPHIDDKHVEAIVLGLAGVPGNISTALRTVAENLI